MNSTISNELTTGPLLARLKKEALQNSYRPGVQHTFRCGVVSCPEVLAVAKLDVNEWLFILSDGYEKGKDAFIKTRRTASRSHIARRNLKDSAETEDVESRKQHIAFMEQASPEEKAVSIEILKERGYGKEMIEEWQQLLDSAEKRKAWLEEAVEERKKVKQRRNLRGDVLGIEELPIIFKCARCGRLSKIIGAG